MNADVANLILEPLKGFRNEFRDFRSKYGQDMEDVKHCLTILERGQGTMRHESADQYDNFVRQQMALHQLTKRIEHLERRLELAD
jgi:hypothetical protein